MEQFSIRLGDTPLTNFWIRPCYEKNDIVESLHLEFCKYILKVKKCTPNYIVYGELGRTPMSINIKARMIGFWQRIINGKKEKISRTLYDMLYRLDKGDIYHSKWLICVRDVLFECGFHNCWNEQAVSRNVNLSRNVKQFLFDKFVVEWKYQIFNSPKCINYRIYKSDFGIEKYFTVLPPDLMYTLIRFRCGSHKLPIETGRFYNIDRSERLCDLCDKEELGDEFHYIFNCTFFNTERRKFIPQHIYNNRNIQSLSDLMNSHDKYTLVGLAKFCKIVMSIFT